MTNNRLRTFLLFSLLLSTSSLWHLIPPPKTMSNVATQDVDNRRIEEKTLDDSTILRSTLCGIPQDVDTLSNDELLVMKDLVTRLMQEHGIPFPQPPPAALRPPWGLWQCKVLAYRPAAVLTTKSDEQINIIQQFSKVSGALVSAKAKEVCDHPQIAFNLRGMAAYNAYLFGVFLMYSLTNEFLTVLYGRIDSKYNMDGLTLLYTMCQHIHCFTLLSSNP